MITLRQLWPATPDHYADIVVTGLTSDSRRVKHGDVFVALRGLRHDAVAFIPQALAAGAIAILVESDVTLPAIAAPVIAIPALAQELGGIAARFYQQPSQALSVVAVTGTNGKTSIAQLIAHACQQLGQKAAVLGTLGNGLIGEVQPSSHTTLDAISLQQQLADFRDAGAQVVALEASSHGLEQGRLNGTAIGVAIFTNLTRDHLDYHQTMAAYQQAKALLFRWPTLQTAILNADDPVSVEFRQELAPTVRCWTYSQQPDSHADFVALACQPSLQGLQLTVRTPFGVVDVHSRLLGTFNISNLLAVLAGLLALDITMPAALSALADIPPVRGRMQCVSVGTSTAVVDYAHTPDALEKVLTSLRAHVTGQLWCVFGCGGDRDAGKRPLMGEIAARLADHVVVTADNPRSEDLHHIIQQIMAGIVDTRHVTVEPDRKAAIHYALAHAQADDLVVIAGKGHEDYQEIAGVRYPFDDAAIVRAWISPLAIES